MGDTRTWLNIDVGEANNGYINPFEKNDYWRFVFDEGRTYQFDLEPRRIGGLPDPYLQIRDADGLYGNLLLDDYDSGGDGRSARIVTHNWSDPFTGYLVVADEEGKAGLYRLSVREVDIAPGPRDDLEILRYRGSQGTFSDGEVAIARVNDVERSSIDYEGDKDDFLIHLVKGVRYDIKVEVGDYYTLQGEKIPGKLTPNLAVRGPSGATEDRNADADGQARVEYIASQTGDHIITIGGKLPNIRSLSSIEFNNRFSLDTHAGAYELLVTASNLIQGTPGDDVIYGTNGDDYIVGLGGNDTIIALNGNDYLLGGAGADKLYGGKGDDTLDGGGGGAVQTGTSKAGEPIFSYFGDFIDGGPGIDTADVSQRDGATVVLDDLDQYGIGGAITGLGGGGRLYLRDVTLGFDVYVDVENVIGSPGVDYVYGNAHGGRVELGGGDDIFDNNETAEGIDIVFGGSGDDRIWTGGGDDIIYGDAGNDYIFGEDGDDTVFGGDGEDYIRGGEGNDWLNGQSGNDTIYGDAGNDYIFGEDGDDKLSGGEGKNYIDGGPGIDTVVYFNTVTVPLAGVFVDLAGGEASGRNLDGLLVFEDTLVNVENVIGSSSLSGGRGHDTILGDDQDNRLEGYSGDDILLGRGGDDTLLGGVGNDILIGGPDNDIIDGGSGLDVAIFAGERSGFSIRSEGNIIQVRDTLGSEGTDTLTAIEILQFDDGFLELATNRFSDGYANERVAELMSSDGFFIEA
jgi:Ca2+-binding RTX toxin-like protein